MRGGLQHSLVAADDRQKRAEPFFAAVAGRGFDRLHRFAAQITRNLHRQSEQVRFHELGGGLKVDFSGTTKYGTNVVPNNPVAPVIKIVFINYARLPFLTFQTRHIHFVN